MTTPSLAYRHASYRATGLWTDDVLGEVLERRAREHPDRELFLFEGRRLTYGGFESWTAAVAADLAERGVGPGDRVLVQLPNCLEALVMQVAAFRAGAVDVPVVPIYREHELRQILADCRPAAVCTVAELGPRRPADEIDALLAELSHEPAVRYLVGADDAHPRWCAVPGPDAARRAVPASPSAAGPALLLYTSGTTAAPKGAVLSGRALFAHLRNFALALDAGPDTTILAATPLSHLGGFVAGVVFPIFLGGRSVIMSGWRPDDAFDLVDRERVRLMMGATIFLQELVERYEGDDLGRHRLSVYACAGAAIPPALIDRAEAAGVRAVRAYGMTETAGVCAIAAATDPVERRREWDGRLLRGTEIEVVDESRTVVAPGTVGELRIRSAQLLDHYTDPAVTAAQLDADGWFYPGDVGRVDDEGWLQVSGRTKDIVNRGGEKFSTGDIEACLLRHPDVRQAAVTAVPDPRLGEAVGAWLAFAPGVRHDDARGLVDHLEAQRLARQKFPVEWHVVAAIPTTAVGKVQKHRLAELDDLALWRTHGPDPTPVHGGSS